MKRDGDVRGRTKGSEIIPRGQKRADSPKNLPMHLAIEDSGLDADSDDWRSPQEITATGSIVTLFTLFPTSSNNSSFQCVLQIVRNDIPLCSTFIVDTTGNGFPIPPINPFKGPFRKFSGNKRTFGRGVPDDQNAHWVPWHELSKEVSWPIVGQVTLEGRKELPLKEIPIVKTPLAEPARIEENELDTTVITHLCGEAAREVLEALERPAQASEGLVEAFRRRAQRK